MCKLVTVDEDSNIKLEDKDIELGGYQNRMIAQAESVKGFIIVRLGTGKRIEIPPGSIIFKEQQKETENG